MQEPKFLTLAEVVEIHADQIQRYGGEAGVRDFGLLESALAQPESSFAGEWLHRDLHDMAAAYAYHLCQNHPFVDGNKRTAITCALVFLALNGINIKDPTAKNPMKLVENTMLAVAAGKMAKAELAQTLRELLRS